MFTIQEEKSLFFPNHSWQDFQRLYVNKLELVTDAFDEFMLRPSTSPELHKNLLKAIIDTTKRLYAIDNVIAKPYDVVDCHIFSEDDLF